MFIIILVVGIIGTLALALGLMIMTSDERSVPYLDQDGFPTRERRED